MDYFLGIDQGTSACRAVIINKAGVKIAFASRYLPRNELNANDGCHQQEPYSWWQACTEAVQEVLKQVDAKQVKGLAIDATSASLLLTDLTGQPISPALMYNDSRAKQHADLISQIAPSDSAAHGASSSLAKLLWLINNQDDTSDFYAQHQADWLSSKFSGCYGLSDENNALKLGYDPRTRQWPAWMERLNLSHDCLPQVLPAGSVIGAVQSSICQQFGLSSQCQVVAGTTDSTAACLAAGISIPGDALTVLGSTLVLKVISERPIFVPEFGIYSHRIGDLWLVGGASNSGGNVLRHYFSDTQLQTLSASINPQQASNLDYYPLIKTGERFPTNDPMMNGRMQPRSSDPVEFLHGLLEGIARIEQQGYHLLNQLGASTITSVRTSGGGAVNATWQTIRQRMLDVPMLPAIHTEAAFGAAQLARNALS